MSHQSGPGNDRFRVSTSDTRQSDIVSFVRFLQAVAGSFRNAWWIWKKPKSNISCFNKTDIQHMPKKFQSTHRFRSSS